MKTKITLTDQFPEEFLSRFFNGELNKDEMIKLREWISSSEDNLSEFEACRKIWLATAIHLNSKKFDPEAAWEKTINQIHAAESGSGLIYYLRKGGNFRKILQIAAMVIILISLGSIVSWLVFSSRDIQITNNSCQVLAPQGSKSQITLPDGSTVWINAGSRLSYTSDYNQKERIVNLEGEGYFNVRSNREKPFIVQTSHLKVKAYGTVFNVKAYPEEKTIVTTLIEGSVEVEAQNNENETHSYTLKPHQNIIYHIDTGISETPDGKETNSVNNAVSKAVFNKEQVQLVNDIKPELYTSWKDENWVLEGVTLYELAPLLDRRFNTKIEILNDSLNKYKFTGTIRNETLEQVLVILRLTTPLEYQVGKGYVTWQLDKELEKDYFKLIKR